MGVSFFALKYEHPSLPHAALSPKEKRCPFPIKGTGTAKLG